MARQPQMNQRPEMPDMRGASMPRQQGQAPDQDTVNQARQNIMQPSAELAAVLVSRLGAMSDEQLAELDRAITPEAAKALLTRNRWQDIEVDKVVRQRYQLHIQQVRNAKQQPTR